MGLRSKMKQGCKQANKHIKTTQNTKHANKHTKHKKVNNKRSKTNYKDCRKHEDTKDKDKHNKF